MTRPDQDGLLDLRFRRDAGGRSGLVQRRQRFPLRMTVPMYLDPADDGMAFVYVQNPTGGVFAGDRLRCEVAAEAGTRVHLTTQSATRLYRMEGGEAEQELRFTLGEGAYVEHIPEALIPQADARFVQRTVVDLGRDAAFVAMEMLAPGRLARRERFAYDGVRLQTAVSRAGRELCVDTLSLEPGRRPPELPGLLGAHDYLGSLLAVAPEHGADALGAELDAMLAGAEDVRAAAGVLPDGAGVLVRILARGAIAMRAALVRAWAHVRRALIGLAVPPPRR